MGLLKHSWRGDELAYCLFVFKFSSKCLGIFSSPPWKQEINVLLHAVLELVVKVLQLVKINVVCQWRSSEKQT